MSNSQDSEQPKKKLSPEKAERLRAFQLKSLQTGWLIQEELERTSGIVSNPSGKRQDNQDYEMMSDGEQDALTQGLLSGEIDANDENIDKLAEILRLDWEEAIANGDPAAQDAQPPTAEWLRADIARFKNQQSEIKQSSKNSETIKWGLTIAFAVAVGWYVMSSAASW